MEATYRLSARDRARLRHIFQAEDKAGLGKVSISDLKPMLAKAEEKTVTDAEVEVLRLRLGLSDRDDVMISFEDFAKAFGYSMAQKQAEAKKQMSDLQRDSLANQQDQMKAEQYVQINGVPVPAVTAYLRKELDETAACLQLPQACTIFLFFFLSVTWHFNYDRLHAVDQAITWDIKENANFAFSGIVPFENGRMGHKNIEDVNSIADFWSWMNMGIVPLFWPQGWDVNEVRLNVGSHCYGSREAISGWGSYGLLDGNYSSAGDPSYNGRCPEDFEVTPPEDTQQLLGDQSGFDGTYLFYHKIIGGVRLRQERTPLIACSTPVQEMQGTVFKGRCVGNEDYWLKPELHRGLRIREDHVNQPGGETIHLPSMMSQLRLREELRELEDRAWFSPQTAKIELLFTTYNANEDLVTATYIMFFLNRGGHIHKIVEPVSFVLDVYASWHMYVADIGWAALVVKLFLEETWEIIKHMRQLGCARGLFVYMNLSNAVDWASILFSLFLAIFWIIYMQNLQDLREHLLSANAGITGSWANRADREAFFDMVDARVWETLSLRTALAIYPFVIVSRFFKAFSSQPRLAMVTKTLAKASTDIFHFVVVFGTVFIIFAVSAMILWGQELEDFANEARSLMTVFRIVLGDYDWEALHSVGRPQAYAWFWTFIWLVNLVMLNMLLAIIMDVYTDVKAGIGNSAETLWSQSIEIWRRWRDVSMGRSVSLKKILKALDPTDLDDEEEEEEDQEEIPPLFPDTMCERVPGMGSDQATSILAEAHRLKVANERSSDTLSDAMVRISKIDQRTNIMAEHIARFIQVQNLQHGEVGKASVVL
uniref:EF-hand domain-containing protein n=1 Tax=Alexandrium monilatum TaxID=311494 RepID=A0A7S4VIU8_9DINO